MMQQSTPSAQPAHAAASNPEAAPRSGSAPAPQAEKESPKTTAQTRIERRNYSIVDENYLEEHKIKETLEGDNLAIREEQVEITRFIRRPRFTRSAERDRPSNPDSYQRPRHDQAWSDFRFSPLALSAAIGSGFLTAEKSALEQKEREPKRVQVARSKKELENLLSQGVDRDQIIVTKLEDEIDQKIEIANKLPLAQKQPHEMQRGIEIPQALDLSNFSLPLRNDIPIPELKALKEARTQSEAKGIPQKEATPNAQDRAHESDLRVKIPLATALPEMRSLPMAQAVSHQKAVSDQIALPEKHEIRVSQAVTQAVPKPQVYAQEDFHLVSIPRVRAFQLPLSEPENRQKTRLPTELEFRKNKEEISRIEKPKGHAISAGQSPIELKQATQKERREVPDFRLKPKISHSEPVESHFPHEKESRNQEAPKRPKEMLEALQEREHYLDLLRKIKASLLSDIRVSKEASQTPRKSAQPFLKLIVEQERALATLEN